MHRKIKFLRKSAQQLSFFGQAPSSAQQKFSLAQLAQLSTIFSPAQLSYFFFKICNSALRSSKKP